MISEGAYNKIKMEVSRQNLPLGVLSESVHLYIKDAQEVKIEHPSWSDGQIQTTLLRPTGVTSLVKRAEENFLDSAITATKNRRLLAGFYSSGASIIIGVISNILFTLLMIGFFLSAQDISESFFRALGFQVVPLLDSDEKKIDSIEPLPLGDANN